MVTDLVYPTALILYFSVHSISASLFFKDLAVRYLLLDRNYRLFYNGLAILALLPILYLYKRSEKQVWFEHPVLEIIGFLLVLTGLWVFFRSKSLFNWSEFAGFQQTRPPLVTTGMLGKIRHPLYASGLLMLSGYTSMEFHLVNVETLLITTVYLIIGIHLEEAKLVDQYGIEYLEYRRQVPMLIPRLWKRRHILH